MKDTCENVHEMLSLYIDDMLTEAETKQVEKHLQTCQACRAEYVFLKSIVSTAQSMPKLTVDTAFHEKIMENVAQAAKESQKPKPARKNVWKLASGFAAAAAVVALSVISLNSLPGHPELTPKGQTEPIQSEAPQEATASETKDSSDTPKKGGKPAGTVQTPAAPTGSEPVLADEQVSPYVRAIPETQTDYPVVSYCFTEEGYQAAISILSGFDKDGEVYLVPDEQTDEIRAKLEAVSGYLEHEEMQLEDTGFLKIVLSKE